MRYQQCQLSFLNWSVHFIKKWREYPMTSPEVKSEPRLIYKHKNYEVDDLKMCGHCTEFYVKGQIGYKYDLARIWGGILAVYHFSHVRKVSIVEYKNCNHKMMWVKTTLVHCFWNTLACRRLIRPPPPSKYHTIFSCTIIFWDVKVVRTPKEGVFYPLPHAHTFSHHPNQ